MDLRLLRVVSFFLGALEDGKITGKELKEFLGLLIDDQMELDIADLKEFLKPLLSFGGK
jgi:hypothetical protein